MRTVTVSVTPTDIAAGKRADCYECPVAIALNRATGEQCSVEEAAIFIGDGISTQGPEVVRFFTSDFDRGLTVSPFTFALELPE